MRGRNSHADLRIIAEGFYQDDGRCRRRDLWPRRGCPGLQAQDYKPQDQKKLTQAAARYQDQPKGNESCGSCPYFVFPKSCVVVEGEISATGWCPIFTTFSPLDRGAHA